MDTVGNPATTPANSATLASSMSGDAASMSTTAALGLVRAIGDELSALHARGGVHAFLSPSVVYRSVSEGWTLSAPPGAGPPPKNHWLAYLPPEERQGGAIDGRTDQYPLALITYELLSGRPRIDRSDLAVPEGTVNEVELVPGRRLRPDLRPQASDVLRRALSRDPASRFATVGEFLAALEQQRVDPTSPAERSGRMERAVRPAVVVSMVVAVLAGGAGITLAVSGEARGEMRDRATIARAGFVGWLELDGASRGVRTASRWLPRWAGQAAVGGSGTADAPGDGSPGRHRVSLASKGGTLNSGGARTTQSGPRTTTRTAPEGRPRPTDDAGDSSGRVDGGEASGGGGYVYVTAAGGRAVVLVNGLPRGIAPLTIRVGAGRHTVRVVGAGGYPANAIDVEVTANDTAVAAFVPAPERR